MENGFAITVALFQDYLVLLPQDYYEATILQQKVNKACTVPGSAGL